MIFIIVIISLSILILTHELGHFLAAKLFGVRVEEFGLGFPPKLFAKKYGETVYSVNALPFGGFVKLFGEDGVEIGKDSFAAQPVWRRSCIVLSGVLMNIVLAWLTISIVFMIGIPEHLVIGEVSKDSPAMAAGLKSNDIIMGVIGPSLEKTLSDPIKSEEFVALIREKPAGPFTLKVQRGKEVLTIILEGRVNPPPHQGPLGVSVQEAGIQKASFFRSFAKAAETTVQTVKLVTIGFAHFFVRIFLAPEVIETLSGPVGIFMLATQAGTLGIPYLLELMALISINLAVLNLMPFPALDGGRFLFLLFEKIKGVPISNRVQRAVNTFGLALLIVLMVLVTINDVGRVVK